MLILTLMLACGTTTSKEITTKTNTSDSTVATTKAVTTVDKQKAESTKTNNASGTNQVKKAVEEVPMDDNSNE